MKELKSFTQEPYEAPAILDIAPVTITQVLGDTVVDDGGMGGGVDD